MPSRSWVRVTSGGQRAASALTCRAAAAWAGAGWARTAAGWPGPGPTARALWGPSRDSVGSGEEAVAWRGQVGRQNGFSSSGAPAALLTQSPILMRNLERAWETRRGAHRCGAGGAAQGKALGRAHLRTAGDAVYLGYPSGSFTDIKYRPEGKQGSGAACAKGSRALPAAGGRTQCWGDARRSHLIQSQPGCLLIRFSVSGGGGRGRSGPCSHASWHVCV